MQASDDFDLVENYISSGGGDASQHGFENFVGDNAAEPCVRGPRVDIDLDPPYQEMAKTTLGKT